MWNKNSSTSMLQHESEGVPAWWCKSASELVCLAKDPKDICPPSDLIKPCYCEKSCTNCHVSLKCDNILEQEDVTEVVKNSNDYQYETFELRKSSVQYIPASLFSIQKITSLYIFTSSLISWFDEAPQVDDFDVLHLNEVRMSRSIQWDLFSGFKKIKRMSIMHTTLRRLDESFKDNIPKNLKELKIYNCSLSRLHDNIFSSFTELVTLELDYGKIQVIKRSMFPSPCKLKRITMSQQKIKELPGDIFSNMPDLKELQLVGNQLAELTKDSFASIVPKLTTFKIHGCLSIPGKLNENESADDVKSASQAELKDMANNGFQKGFDDHCKSWRKCIVSSEDWFSFNMRFSPGTFESHSLIFALIPLFFADYRFDNPIKCGCSIHWITSIDRSRWRGPWFSGECTAPKELKGKSLKELNNSHFEHCRE
ncbi:uncharacterized protein TNCV_3789221 [Trichonephila clavipes]|nr:uncharacterized protein TNCV_3789221 [Trichonephila clavipes]